MKTTAEGMDVQIGALPLTLEALIALRDELAVTPEGGAVMMVLALMLFARDPEGAGRDGLIVCADQSRLVAVSEGYRGWSLPVRDWQHLTRQMQANNWLPSAYVVGTLPESGYRLPEPPYSFKLSRNPYSGDEDAGRVKVFVACSGAASPRPVTLQRNPRGLWKAVEWSSLTLGVVRPSLEVDDGL